MDTRFWTPNKQTFCLVCYNNNDIFGVVETLISILNVLDNVPEHVHYTSKQKEYMMEKKIRELAQLDEQMIREKTLKMKPRVRRQVPQMFQSPNQLFPHLSPLPDSLFYPPAPSFPQQFPLFGLQYPPTPFPREFIPPFNPITTPYIPPIANQFTTMYPPNVVTQLSPFTTYQPPILNQITTQLPPNVGTQSISAFTAPSVAQSLTTLAPPLTTTPPGIPGLKPPPDFNEFKKMLGLGDDISQSPDAENGEPKVVVLEPWVRFLTFILDFHNVKFRQFNIVLVGLSSWKELSCLRML